MSEELVIRCCAPTLASIKTANMFTCHYPDEQAMNESIRLFNRRLRSKGLHMVPLRYRDGVGLIYVYRPKRLRRDLCNEKACQLLREHGYECTHCTRCVQQLRQKLKNHQNFPHEIGLFLGYPPEDVDGFIHRKGQEKCTGHWKVYGDADAVQKTFALYKKCTSVYLRHWHSGSPLERLTVAG